MLKRIITGIAAVCCTFMAQAGPDSLDIRIGQMIMVGIGGRTSLAPSDPVGQAIAQGQVGGVVLFENNIAAAHGKEKLKQLIAACQSKATIPLFVSIDEEGGSVHRLKKKYGFIDMPSAQKLGRINNTDTTRFYYRRLASLLSDLGINLNYAPAVDVAVNPDNPVIVRNGRSFSSDPEAVARHASACIAAHHDFHVLTILKHFPGHGSSKNDSHLGIVNVTNTWKPEELIPYRRLFQSGNYDGVMTAHIINRSWDESLLPATLSSKVVSGMLRGDLGYQGVVFSDDMQMGAIAKNYGFERAIMLAINSGVDVLMFTNSVPDGQKKFSVSEIHRTIRRLVQEGKIPEARIRDAYRRIMLLKSRLPA